MLADPPQARAFRKGALGKRGAVAHDASAARFARCIERTRYLLEHRAHDAVVIASPSVVRHAAAERGAAGWRRGRKWNGNAHDAARAGQERLRIGQESIKSIVAQDLHVDELIPIGLRSRFAVRGRYSWQEQAQREFNCWLVRRYKKTWQSAKAAT